jgi:hypothetical protein
MRLGISLYLLLFSLCLLTAAGHFFSTDHIAVYLTTESAIERHELSIEPMNDAVPGRDGRYYSAFGLGQSVAIAPLYLIGRAVDSHASPRVRAYFGGRQLGAWGGTVPIFFVSLLNQLLMPLVCVLFFECTRTFGYRARDGLLATFVFAFATSAWVYARDSFQHPLETLMLLGAFHLLASARHSHDPRRVVAAGAALAFGIFTRINVAIVVPLFAAYLAWCVWEQNRDVRAVFDRVTLLAIPIALTLLAMMVLNDVRFGRPLAFHAPGQAAGLSTPVLVGLYGNLLSPGRSVFLYSPPIVLGIALLPAFARRFKAEALLIAGIGLAYLGLYSTYGHWDGGWSYGPRFFLPVVALLMLPFAGAFSSRRLAWLAALLSLAGLLVQIPGVALNVGFVYSDWTDAKLVPPDAYLWTWSLSAIPTHWRHLLAGRYIDLWLLEVYRNFGAGVFLLTLAVPIGLFAAGAAMLRSAMRGVLSSEPVP